MTKQTGVTFKYCGFRDGRGDFPIGLHSAETNRLAHSDVASSSKKASLLVEPAEEARST